MFADVVDAPDIMRGFAVLEVGPNRDLRRDGRPVTMQQFERNSYCCFGMRLFREPAYRVLALHRQNEVQKGSPDDLRRWVAQQPLHRMGGVSYATSVVQNVDNIARMLDQCTVRAKFRFEERPLFQEKGDWVSQVFVGFGDA